MDNFLRLKNISLSSFTLFLVTGMTSLATWSIRPCIIYGVYTFPTFEFLGSISLGVYRRKLQIGSNMAPWRVWFFFCYRCHILHSFPRKEYLACDVINMLC
ncbi:unnamed protein product, partial [Brassica rapa subsp. trilocularis]